MFLVGVAVVYVRGHMEGGMAPSGPERPPCARLLILLRWAEPRSRTLIVDTEPSSGLVRSLLILRWAEPQSRTLICCWHGLFLVGNT